MGSRSTLLVLLFFTNACLEPYEPRDIGDPRNLLTIDGFVNTTDKVASVKLTHPSVLNGDEGLVPESEASVSIITDSGEVFQLAETAPGTYTRQNLSIANGMHCQLRVSTKDGAQYESDLVEMRETPPIDSAYFRFLENGVEVDVDTHDPTNLTRYYQWSFEETWEYTARFESNFKLYYIGQQPVWGPRSAAERIYRCYKTVRSPRITIASTEHLAVDKVSRKQLVTIPSPSPKTAIRYSVLVRQRAITKDEFNYLTQLQATTENIGGLFDPQPAQVYGNIRSVGDNTGRAIGYFSGGSQDERRIFLGFYDLPPHLLVPLPRSACQIDTVCLTPPRSSTLSCSIDIFNMSPTQLLIDEVQDERISFGFTKTTDDCADCRKQGGILVKPDFW